MSTFKSYSGGYSSESMYGSYGSGHDQKPCMGNSSSQEFVPGSRWWLNCHGVGGEYSHDQLNVFGTEVKFSEAGEVNGDGKRRGENQFIEEYWTACPKNDAAFCTDASSKRCYSHCKDSKDSWLPEFETTVIDDLLSNVDLMDLGSCNSLLLERSKKLSSDLDSHWIALKKKEPWWHAADKDELASLVCQTPPYHIRDSGCPGIPVLHVEKISDNHVDTDQFNEHIMNNVLNVADCTQRTVTSASVGKSLDKQGIVECLLEKSDGTFSNHEGLNTTETDSSDAQEPTSSDLTRAQLLEALCHSQTRAREAEKLAQKACDEKDHVSSLFFQQASWLFTYRQWLHLLQLESLCLHLRSKSHLPVPWVQSKGVTVRKNRERAGMKKQGKQRCHVRNCAISFAVGLSLAGAGLLVGWTIGWLFPSF